MEGTNSFPIESTKLYSSVCKSVPWARLYIVLYESWTSNVYSIHSTDVERKTMALINQSFAHQLLKEMLNMGLITVVQRTGKGKSKDMFQLYGNLFSTDKLYLIAKGVVAKAR